MPNTIGTLPKFQGVECWTARELAVQLARHWDEGVKDLRQGFILPWLRDELRDQDLARFSMELTADKRYSEDERLLRLIIKLAPDLPPVYKGISLAKSDLVILGSKATQGDLNNASYVKELYERKILSVFSEHGETIDHKKIQSAWIEAVDMYEEGWRIIIQKGAQATLKPELNSVLPGLLLINISKDFSEHLRKETVNNTTDYAVACEWFMALDHPDKAKLPHLLILRLLTHEADRLVREAEKNLAREIESIKSEFAILLQDKENNLGNELEKLEKILTRNEYSLILNAIQQIPVIRQRAIMDKPNKIFAQAQAEEAEQRKIFPPDFKKAIEIYQEAERVGHPSAMNSISELSKLQESYSITLAEAISNEINRIDCDPFDTFKEAAERNSGCGCLVVALGNLFVLFLLIIISGTSSFGVIFLLVWLAIWFGSFIKYCGLVITKTTAIFFNYFRVRKRWFELNKINF